MSRRRQNRGNFQNGELPPAQEIPEYVSGSVERLKNRLQERATINLEPNSYREHLVLTIAESAVHIATVGKAQPTFTPEQHQRFFRVADLYSQAATLPAHRLDVTTGQLKPVEIQTEPVRKEGYLLYVPARAIQCTSRDGAINAKAFTHHGVNGSEAGIVSLVTADRSEAHTERAFMAATEIAQNRIAVTGVQLETGKLHTTWQAYEPFQESLANGIGNMLGSVAIGSNYQQYSSYINDVYQHHSMFGNELPGSLFGKGLMLVAPHIMFDRPTYEQFADGEMPAVAPNVISVIPDATAQH